jgi:uncharacterized protein YndB with AHSA1/START domain
MMMNEGALGEDHYNARRVGVINEEGADHPQIMPITQIGLKMGEIRCDKAVTGSPHSKEVADSRVYNASMTNPRLNARTRNSKVIKASPEALYRAFTKPEALAVWQAPGDMTAKVHEFDGRLGGGYTMSLFYPPSEQKARGKTSKHEDRFTARFLELTPLKRIVQAITFESGDLSFSGTMIMVVTFENKDGGTEVTMLFENIPPGIRLEDNEAGTRSSLEKLARYVE